VWQFMYGDGTLQMKWCCMEAESFSVSRVLISFTGSTNVTKGVWSLGNTSHLVLLV
jgi:hypothetical protein